MKKPRIIIGIVAAVLIASGFVYIGLKNNIFADVSTTQYDFSGDGTKQDSCSVATEKRDCDDGIKSTADKCNVGAKTGSYCTHKLDKPVILCGIDPRNKEDFVNSGLPEVCNLFALTGQNITDLNLPINKPILDKISASGKILLAISSYDFKKSTACAINSQKQIADKDGCISDIYNKIKSDSFDKGYNLKFDELHTGWSAEGGRELEDLLTIALHRLKKDYPSKIFFVAAPSGIPDNATNKISLARGMTFADYFMPEFYYSNARMYFDGDRAITKQFSISINNYINFVPSVRGRILPYMTIADTESYTRDTNPAANYLKFLEAQVSQLKKNYNEGKTSGITFFSIGRANYETKSWIARIVDNLFNRASSTTLSKDVNNWFDNGIINNPSFESELNSENDWQESHSDNGSVTVKDPKKLSPPLIKSSSGEKLPDYSQNQSAEAIRQSVLYLKRGDQANSVTQAINNLDSEKIYQAVIYSKKYSGDYRDSNVKSQVVNQAGIDITTNYQRNSFLIDATKCSDYAANACPYQQKYWTKETMIFKRPTSGSLQLRIDDSAAAIGEESIVDFVSIREYTLNYNKPTISLNVKQDETINTSKFNLSAEAQSDNGVLKVEFFANDKSIEVSRVPAKNNFSTIWDVSSLNHSSQKIKAIAYDYMGNVAERSVNVQIDLVSPSVTAVPGISHSFPTGFSTLGVKQPTSTALLASAGLTVYKFDGVNNKWLVAPTDSFTLTPLQSYYVYNPSTSKTISLPTGPADTGPYVLTKGWNLLSTQSAKQRSQIQLNINKQTKSATDWITQKTINDRIFIIDTPTATNSCPYFSLLETTDTAASCPTSLKKQKTIPSGKAFWVYVK